MPSIAQAGGAESPNSTATGHGHCPRSAAVSRRGGTSRSSFARLACWNTPDAAELFNMLSRSDRECLRTQPRSNLDPATILPPPGSAGLSGQSHATTDVPPARRVATDSFQPADETSALPGLAIRFGTNIVVGGGGKNAPASHPGHQTFWRLDDFRFIDGIL
jgi:hypothetical protein